jgi:hypothetical protein
MDKNNKKQIKEATGDSTGSRGSYVPPLQPGIRVFKKSQMGAFTERVSNYYSPELEYDSYDGSMSKTKKEIKKIEYKAKKVSDYIKKHPEQNDEDGGVLNQTPGKDKTIVPIVREWVEITKDTILEDIVPNGLKTPSNYNKVIDKFRRDIPENKLKAFDLITSKIKDYIQDRGFNVKVLNACNTGFQGVRTSKSIIICSPESISNFASFVYILFHELKHEQQMSEFDLKDSYMGDIEDFEEFYKIYWDMEMDADIYGKDWVKKIGNILKLPENQYSLGVMVVNYPTMSGMIKNMMTQLHNHVQVLKKQGMSYTDISDLDIVKKHLDKLEDMF